MSRGSIEWGPTVPKHVSASEPTPPYAHALSTVPGRRIRLGGGVVDFGGLMEPYSAEFVARLLDAFAQEYGHGNIPRPSVAASAIRKFLLFVASHALSGRAADAMSRFYTALIEGRAPEKQDLNESVALAIDILRELNDFTFVATRNLRTRDSFATILKTTLRALAPLGFWPRLDSQRTNICTRPDGHSTPSLGELIASSSDAEVSGIGDVMMRSRVRLAAVRACLAQILDEEWRVFQEGRTRLNSHTAAPLELIAKAVRKLPSDYGLKRYRESRHSDVAAVFPIADENTRMANLLTYQEQVVGGPLRIGPAHHGWWRLVKVCGGEDRLNRMIAGSGRAFVAAQTIILIDTGFNLQPCSEMLVEPVCLEARHGKQVLSTLTSHKMRAAGKIVASVLSNYEGEVELKRADGQIGALTVISRWREMSRLSRKRAAEQNDGSDRFLWLLPDGLRRDGRVTNTPRVYEIWAKINDELNRVPALAGLHITRKSIRTTMLQLHAADASLEVAVVALVAGHVSQATSITSYLNRKWFHHELDRLIRHFQDQFEAILLDEEKVSADLLGLGALELADRRRSAIESGLGFACADPLAGHQPGTTPDVACTKLEACVSCGLLRFAPTDSAMRALVITELSLTAAWDEHVAQNPERWALLWMPLLALARATLQRLRGGYRRRTLETIETRVAAEVREGAIALVKPW